VSEADVLNPTQDSLLSPDYGFRLDRQRDGMHILEMDGGDQFVRRERFPGRIYELAWGARHGIPKVTMHALRQWEAQYERDFFTFWDYEDGRGFSGRFVGPLLYVPEDNDHWVVTGRFIELVGKAMNTYPGDWARDANFIEERDSSGTDLVVLEPSTGWNFDAAKSYLHPFPGSAYYSDTANATARWHYFGYGFRWWSIKDFNLGIAEITCTRLRDGVVVAGPTNVDLYNATLQNSAALLTVTNLPLDRYEVKARRTGTKNAASAGTTCYLADTIEVMR